MRKFIKISLSLVVLVMASACSTSTWDVDKVKKMEATGTLFDKALKHEYTELAARERAEGDWKDTEIFLIRAREAALGASPMPEGLAYRVLPAESEAEVRTARARLMRALNGGARSKNPEKAAWAQAGFECWTQELEENIQPMDIAECKKSFYAAMDMIERRTVASPAMLMKGKYVVYFAFASAKVTSDSMAILKEASRYYGEENPSRVMVSGHADRVGNAKANVVMSRKRAAAVSMVLNKQGVPSDKIKIQAFGEYQPEVSTADGVREARNRRVVVQFEK